MHQSYMGGGGYITGLLINPINPDIVYARCDVAGMFKSVDGGKSWEAINNGMTECHHHSVETFAIHPTDPDILFRCSGEARDHKMTGTIHKSVDGGKNMEKSLGRRRLILGMVQTACLARKLHSIPSTPTLW
ncbi:MAG: hypothetical protein HC830_08050 [Bacteroidetes bacterium]|nr:hypothetical protein [Bacteroidota bacterium]